MKNLKLNEEISKACLRIAPAWSLENVVAVNPYLGLSDLKFNDAAQLLSERAGINMGMDKYFYLDQIEKKNITKEDIVNALIQNNASNTTSEAFIKEVKFLSISTTAHDKFKAGTVTDAAEELTRKYWNDFMIEKISNWASSHFDKYQALWSTSTFSEDLFFSWKQDAEVDMSTELMGIKNFRKILKEIPNNSELAVDFVLNKLAVPQDIQETYFHTLLLKVIGWSSFIRGKDWDNSLNGKETNHLKTFLSILLCWEYCMHESFHYEGVQLMWADYKTELQNHSEEGEMDEYLEARMILQDAYDISCQRNLKEKFNAHKPKSKQLKRAKAQAVFCIDVRSEVYRRNLEKVDSDFETIGFAGFFGFPIEFSPIAHDKGQNLCPALIPSGPKVKEVLSSDKATSEAIKNRKSKHQVNKVFKYFKSGAVSSFSFVSPLGLFYLPKIISDSFGITRPVSNPKSDGLKSLENGGRELDLSSISLDDKINMAESALTAMGLSENMSPLVLITGHGSSSVNNPHATGLDCGACGGHSGEINAMTAEKILNDISVRISLKNKGIVIPDDTHFMACLHDTTTDEITLIGEAKVPSTHSSILRSVKASLTQASIGARKERSVRLGVKGNNLDTVIKGRNKDWSQVRPEWGLAGCNSFIIGPRHRTKGMNLGGRSFLQSYDWKKDSEFKILESIMAAPMVVTSWINLQYYASTTDNKRLGAGNKTLHNVTAGLGVLEGASGDLRIGLPIQSVHDGKNYQHLPNRLNVIIEAPIDAINNVLAKHKNLKELVDNSWITILNMDEEGKLKYKYNTNLTWTELELNKSKTYELTTF